MMRGLLVLAATLAALFGLLKWAEPHLTYPLNPEHVAPARIGLPDMAEETHPTPDGETLVMWLHPPAPGQPLILYLHGNAGNLAVRADRFRRFIDWGFGVAAPSYRGGSGSTGRPSERVIRGDIARIAADLRARFPDSPVIYYGESMGTGVAADLARTAPPNALVLEAPYTSIPDAALKAPAPAWLAAIFANRWDTAQAIASLTAPLLILHGTRDRVIPIAQGEQVFENATTPDKRMIAVPGAGHFDVWQVWVQKELRAFLTRVSP